MRSRLLIALIATSCALAAACERGGEGAREPSPPAEDATPEVRVAPLARLDASRLDRARARVLHFECNRCHVIEGVPPAPTQKNCVTCHQQILAGSYDGPEASPENLARWKENIEHLTKVPSLRGLAARFERRWFVEFLQHPHNLRPRLGAEMPRLDISAEDAEVLADHFFQEVRPGSPTQPAGDASRGARLIEEKGCGTCHVMTGAPIAARPIPTEVAPDVLARAMKLAPDLRHVRDRFRREQLAQWIRDPASLSPDASMPKIPMSEQDARDIAAHLLSVELAPAPAAAIPERLPVLEREVTWEEVSREVLREVCWHCHSEADYVDGDGGPGNTGGFGFAGRRLSVAEYSSISSGMLDADGERVSVFRPREDGTPWIVAAMHARYAEVAGQPVEGIRGMPLGLPPMSLEQIQLVESWIAQGRPRQ